MSVIRKAIEPYLGYIKLAGLGIAFGLSVWAAVSAYSWAYNNGHRDAETACLADKLALSQAAIEDLQEARAKEQAIAKKLADAAKQYEQDKIDAQTAADRLVADLRAGNKRLHDRWQASLATARVSGDAASIASADAAERERQDSAARIIAAADRCDAQVSGLQEAVRAYTGVE